MADAPLSSLATWMSHLGRPNRVNAREIQTRLAVIGPLDWSASEGQALLAALLPRIAFKKAGGDFDLPSMRCLDVLERAGAFPAAWSVLITPYLAPQSTVLAAWFLLSIPPASRLTKPSEERWLNWASRAVSETPHLSCVAEKFCASLRSHVLNEVVNACYFDLAKKVIRHWPEVFQAPDPDTQKLWLNARSKEHAWAWALENGLDPHAKVSKSARPFWWRAYDQGCRIIGNWAVATVPEGAKAYKVARYFKNLELPGFYPQEKVLDRLTCRSDWATLKNEHGDAALWTACHHHLWLTCCGPRPEIQASAGWAQTVDRDGRNLAFAVLTSPDSRTDNEAKEESLRHLARNSVHLVPDGQGRGLAISWPDLTATKNVVEMALSYSGEERWWKGTPAQMEQAIAVVANTGGENWMVWQKLFTTVPSHDPRLQVIRLVIDAALGAKDLPIPLCEPVWPQGLQGTPLWNQAMASPHGPEIEAHRRMLQTLKSVDAHLNSRPRFRP